MDQHQKPLWIDTWADAVKAVIDACGGPKKVGSELRPDLPADDAGEWLTRTLSDRRREVMAPQHVIALMQLGRRHNCDVLAAYLLDQSGYEPPRPIKIEAEAQRVSAQLSDVLANVSRQMERLQRYQGLQPK